MESGANWDFYKRLLEDDAFHKQVLHLAHQLEVHAHRPGSQDKMSKILRKLVRLCNHNLGLLFPYTFQSYLPPKLGSAEPRPLSLMNRPFAWLTTTAMPYSKSVLRAGRQASKSTTLGGLHLIVSHVLGLRNMYLAPHTEQATTFARRVRELERGCAFPVSNRFKQNDYYKEYPSGGIFEIAHAYTGADHIRGKTEDMLTIDEAQNFDGGLFPEIEQILKVSQWPIFNVAGSSLTMDTFLEAQFQSGSQGLFHIRCPGRTKSGEPRYLNCGDPDQSLKAIRERGLCCPWTGKLLNPVNGFFVHAYPRRFEDYNTSVHVPQIIIPDFVNNPMEWRKIWNSYTEYTTAKFLQEVLGIPTEKGARELTEQEMESICVLGSQDDLVKKARTGSRYKYIVSGCDWGGSDYNRALKTKTSFTVHVILGITHDNKFDILHMRQYSGMGYKEIVGHILSDHRYYGASALASDFGAGQAYNFLLREPGGLDPRRHVVFDYVGPRTAPIATPKGENNFVNLYMLNRNEAITELFLAIKNQRIRCYNWDQAQTRLSEFLNVVRVHKESEATGATSFRYIRAGDQPDDTLHAVNFAYVLGRLMLGETLCEDQGLITSLRGQLTGPGGAMNRSIPDPYAG
jgi:hypothetical protein